MIKCSIGLTWEALSEEMNNRKKWRQMIKEKTIGGKRIKHTLNPGEGNGKLHLTEVIRPEG